MISGSRNRAASRYGVDPISVAGRFQSVVSRRSGVPFAIRTFGSAPRARSALTRSRSLLRIAACSAEYPLPNALGSAPCSSSSAANVAIAAVRREHERAHTIRLCVVRVGAGLQQQPRGLDVADPRRKQQRRGAAAQHRVIQLLASRALRLLADDGLRIGQGARANIGTGFERAAATTSG